MTRMHAIVKALLIGTAIAVPVAIFVSVTEPSDGVAGLVALATISLCAWIAAGLYESELDSR